MLWYWADNHSASRPRPRPKQKTQLIHSAAMHCILQTACNRNPLEAINVNVNLPKEPIRKSANQPIRTKKTASPITGFTILIMFKTDIFSFRLGNNLICFVLTSGGVGVGKLLKRKPNILNSEYLKLRTFCTSLIIGNYLWCLADFASHHQPTYSFFPESRKRGILNVDPQFRNKKKTLFQMLSKWISVRFFFKALLSDELNICILLAWITVAQLVRSTLFSITVEQVAIPC